MRARVKHEIAEDPPNRFLARRNWGLDVSEHHALFFQALLSSLLDGWVHSYRKNRPVIHLRVRGEGREHGRG